MACAYYHQGDATHTHTQYSALVYLHDAKFISFSTSCHLLISSPASSITSTNRKPVIHLDSGACLPAQQKVGILSRFYTKHLYEPRCRNKDELYMHSEITVKRGREKQSRKGWRSAM